VSAITRWTLAGALAATGFFAGLASQSGRGTTTAAAKTRAALEKARRQSTNATRRSEGDDDNNNGFVQAPAPVVTPQLPTPPPAPSGGFTPIVSGAS